MIIFQITLTGPMLTYLAALKHQDESGSEAWTLLSGDGRFVTTMQSLIRQQLASHELPTNYKSAMAHEDYKWADKKRRFIYEISPKGTAALQLAGFDLEEFLTSIRKGLPGAVSPRYTELYADTPDGQKPKTGRGRHIRSVAVGS